MGLPCELSRTGAAKSPVLEGALSPAMVVVCTTAAAQMISTFAYLILNLRTRILLTAQTTILWHTAGRIRLVPDEFGLSGANLDENSRRIVRSSLLLPRRSHDNACPLGVAKRTQRGWALIEGS